MTAALPSACPRCGLPPLPHPSGKCMNGWQTGHPCMQPLANPPPGVTKKRKRRKPEDRETPILRRIQKYLAQFAPEVRCRRQSVGHGYTKDHKPTSWGTPGDADLIVCAWGYYLEIEVKAPDGRQQDNQKECEAATTAAFGEYVLARSVEDVMDAIERLRARMREDAWLKRKGMASGPEAPR